MTLDVKVSKLSPNKSSVYDSELNHCGLVTPYGDSDKGLQWLR